MNRFFITFANSEARNVVVTSRLLLQESATHEDELSMEIPYPAVKLGIAAV